MNPDLAVSLRLNVKEGRRGLLNAQGVGVEVGGALERAPFEVVAVWETRGGGGRRRHQRLERELALFGLFCCGLFYYDLRSRFIFFRASHGSDHRSRIRVTWPDP